MGAVCFSMDVRLLSAFKKLLSLDVFVETGTFKGETVELIKNEFAEIYTIELSEEYFMQAQLRFANESHINVVSGDSSKTLATIASKLQTKSVLYFLDAHWCEANNAAGKTSQCPLLEEIRAIGSLNEESVIIIDDARLFVATPLQPHDITQWPDFDDVLTSLHSISANHKLMVLNDSIVFYPGSLTHEIVKVASEIGVDWLSVCHKTKDYDNLRLQFIELNNQLIDKEIEIQRLSAALNHHPIPCGSILPFDSGECIVPLPAGQLADKSVLLELTEKVQHLTAELEIAQTVQIEKEEVIRVLANAVRAYRLGYMAIKPVGFLLSPFRPIIRHGRAMLRPRLGNLNQYPPQPLTLQKIKQNAKQLTVTPKISIVTPSFRQGGFIEKTLLSVLEQKYKNIEYFVQDGASEDNTVSVLEKYENEIAGWESISDTGQSQAINRGFAKTSGEIMAWLNSDDLLLPNALNTVADYFNRHPDVDVVYGNRLLIDENDMEIGRWIMPGHDSAVLSWVDYIPQETMFWRRRIWDKVGGQIDESFRFAMDWDLLVRFRDAGARFAHIPYFLGAFRIHEHQKTSANINDIGQQEMNRIRERVLGRVPSYKEIRNAALPYLLKHVAVDLTHRVKARLGKSS